MKTSKTLTTIGIILIGFIFIMTTPAEVRVIKSNQNVFPRFDPRVDALYYGIPPLYYDSSVMTVVAFRSSYESLRALAPEPLEINSDNLAWAYMFDDYLTDSFQYLEGGIVIPVSFTDKTGTKKGLFVSYMYLDTPDVMAIAAGREIWGYPKKDAKITYDYSTYPSITASMERKGVKIMDFSVDMTQMLDGPWYSFPSDVFNLKYIPSIKAEAPPEVLQITISPDILDETPFPLFKATLEFDNSVEDHLADYLVIEEVLGGIFVPSGESALVHGDILFNYLTEKIPDEGYRLGPDTWIYRWNK